MSPKQNVSVFVEIDAPIWRVYQNWKRLDRFPLFVPAVKEARSLTPTQLYWRQTYEGRDYISTFEIAVRADENSLSWHSLTGPASAGTAHCVAQRQGGTTITLTIDFAPDDEMQSVAAVIARHAAFLKGFKQFVEAPAVARLDRKSSPR